MRHGGRTLTLPFAAEATGRWVPALITGAVAMMIAASAPQLIGNTVAALNPISRNQAAPQAQAKATVTPVPQSIGAATAATSPDHSPISYGSWGAGYVADAPSGEAFTAVSARFVAPATSAAPSTPGGGWVSIWGGVGLQALDGDQLMQAGISMYATPGGYWEVTAPWWINEPVTPTVPHVLSMSVRPGDTVEMDAGRIDASHWGFRVTDATTGATATGECSGCQSDGLTAAWIMEDPLSGSGSGQTGFANPGTVQFLSAAASLDSGPLTPLAQLDWHPLLREVGSQTQRPLGTGGPSAGGAFAVG